MNETGFWDAAYRDSAPALLGVLRRYVKDTDVAQDLLHEVFITAIGKYGSYTGKGCFEGWLHRIAVNTALMHLRNEKNRKVPAEAVMTIAGDDADDNRGDDARAAIEAAGFSGEELLAAIDRLPEHHKLVFNMYVMDGFSHRQIGAELNISPGTSKSHLARARRKIQQFLYDDALKKKLRGRRRVSALVLLFPAKTHFIDSLYRKGLSDFSLPPAEGVQFLSAALEEHAASAAASVTASQTAATVAFWGSKLSYVAVCCGTAAVTATVCRLSMSSSPPNADQTAPVTDTRVYPPEPAVADSSTYDASKTDATDTFPAEKKMKIPEKNILSGNDKTDTADTVGRKTPVVVKKQIIRHQTVVIRDTVIIIE